MDAGLYIVGTPIGNLGDISERALETLRGVEAILAEDTRHTQKLLSRFEIHTRLISCHGFNEARRIEPALDRIRAGAAIALVTDSGMPGISDPGSRVTSACREAGLPLFVVPGPTAVASAVSLSGFGGAGFVFDGFLPHKSGARRRRLAELLAMGPPVVLYESPYRLMKLLDELVDLAPDCEVFVGREMTKLYEQSIWGTPEECRTAYTGRTVKGELALVIRPAKKSACMDAVVDSHSGRC